MSLEFFLNNPEWLWVITVFYDLLIVVSLFYFFGKNGLYVAVILGIVLGNLQGGKVSDLSVFGYTFTVSMGAIMYSGIYFATDLINENCLSTEVIVKFLIFLSIFFSYFFISGTSKTKSLGFFKKLIIFSNFKYRFY